MTCSFCLGCIAAIGTVDVQVGSRRAPSNFECTYSFSELGEVVADNLECGSGLIKDYVVSVIVYTKLLTLPNVFTFSKSPLSSADLIIAQAHTILRLSAFVIHVGEIGLPYVICFHCL